MKKRSIGSKKSLLDSNDFSTGSFKPHGRSEIWTEGHIVHVETEGPFNVEAVAAINRTRLELFAINPPDAAYAYINKWNVSVMMSLEALAEYSEGLHDAYIGRFRPPSAMAWIFPVAIEGASIMKLHYEKLFAAVGIPFQIFTEEEAANTWVRQQLGLQ